MPRDVMVDSGAFEPCPSEDAFPRQSGAVEHARGYWRDHSTLIREEESTLQGREWQRSNGRPPRYRLCIARELGTRDGDGQVRDVWTNMLQKAFRSRQHVQ